MRIAIPFAEFVVVNETDGRDEVLRCLGVRKCLAEEIVVD